MNEEALKTKVRHYLSPDFIIREEVEGVHIVTGEKVKIDFLIYPKQHLLENGFEDFWVGIEVKSPNVKESHKNGTKIAWQAITYKQSIFEEKINPAFVLTYPRITEFYKNLNVLNETTGTTFTHNEGRNVGQLLQRANVGHLELRKDCYWSLKFESEQFYYSNKKGKGQVKNLGVTVHVGSTKRNLTIK